MPLSRRSFSRRANWLFTVLAIIAMAAQAVVAVAPLGEGSVARAMSAHVESPGATGHVAHNEATCASCQARSIHGTVARPAFVLPEGSRAGVAPLARVVRAVTTDLHFQSNPRAPPLAI